ATVPSTTTFTYAQTGPNVTSGGGSVSTGASTVTVKVTSTADPNKSATASVTIVAAADPTLASINPSSVAEGSLFEDVYLAGTNFRSTNTVLVNGTPVTATVVSLTVLRARISDAQLAAPGNLAIQVTRQNGGTTPVVNLAVVPVRPALVGAAPDSGIQSGAAFSFNVDGGYYGTSGSPAVTAEFDGNVRAASVTSRQLSLIIGPNDLTTPGLVSFDVRNSAVTQPAAAPQQIAAANLAVQPSATPPSIVATLAVGTKPGAVAINTATGMAVVANHDSNSISLIDLTATPPAILGSPIPVGLGPTGVAVDNLRNLAVVANNGDNSISVVNLMNPSVAKITTNINTAPFSVGVNPLTGLAVIAYQSTNVASIIDLRTNTVVGAVTANTGAARQVDVEPKLNWALVTPGGAGTLSIVDLGRQNSNAIAAAPNGAARSSNVVTITTTTAHGLSVGQAVLITGVADSSFNGYFTVVSIPSSTTFTYAQSAANSTSGGGAALYANALATVTVGTGIRGVGVNPET